MPSDFPPNRYKVINADRFARDVETDINAAAEEGYEIDGYTSHLIVMRNFSYTPYIDEIFDVGDGEEPAEVSEQ